MSGGALSHQVRALRRFGWAGLVLASWAGPFDIAATGAPGTPGAAVDLVVNGRPALVVYVSKGAAREEIDAASLWARVLAKMGGQASTARMAVTPPDITTSTPGVFLGGTTPGQALLTDHPPKDREGFAVAVDATRRRVVIAGRTPRGTYSGVVRFLQRHAGVEWFFPGELGEVIASRPNWSVPAGVATEAPAYLSRWFSGLSGPEELEWARRNLLNARFAFHHALARIFTPALFDTHPEFFPLRQGKRYRPGPNDWRWQPDLANPAVAIYAAEQAAKYFDANPDAVSYSLGINDGIPFDEGPATKALTEPRRSFRERPDYSDLVFTFMNRAAKHLARSHPDKFLGCLAYRWAENTPSFAVHPQVLPYLTNDRSFYDTPAWADEDLGLIRRWAAAGPRVIGIYDYYYGRLFTTPRIFTSAMVASLRRAYAEGVRGFYAELYPRWEYDALKAWLAARLLWDLSADPAALQTQFYRNLYGAAAADVQAFFREAEGAWRDQPGPPRALKGYKDQPTQVGMFSPARVTTMTTVLRQAAKRDLEPAMRARLARVEGAWAESCRTITERLTVSERTGRPPCP